MVLLSSSFLDLLYSLHLIIRYLNIYSIQKMLELLSFLVLFGLNLNSSGLNLFLMDFFNVQSLYQFLRLIHLEIKVFRHINTHLILFLIHLKVQF